MALGALAIKHACALHFAWHATCHKWHDTPTVQRFPTGPLCVFLFVSSFLLLLPYTFSLYPTPSPLHPTFPSHSPLKSSTISFNFLRQILYFPHKFSFSTLKLLKFAQFNPIHLPLSLSKTLTSIVEVKGCRESKASICSHFFILLASFGAIIFDVLISTHHWQETGQ